MQGLTSAGLQAGTEGLLGRGSGPESFVSLKSTSVLSLLAYNLCGRCNYFMAVCVVFLKAAFTKDPFK